MQTTSDWAFQFPWSLNSGHPSHTSCIMGAQLAPQDGVLEPQFDAPRTHFAPLWTYKGDPLALKAAEGNLNSAHPSRTSCLGALN